MNKMNLLRYINEISILTQVDEIVKKSNELIQEIKIGLSQFQEVGLQSILEVEIPSVQIYWEQVHEVFIPFSDFELEKLCYLWHDLSTRFVSSFKDYNDLQCQHAVLSFCVRSDGKSIQWLLGSNNYKSLENNLAAFFPGSKSTKFNPLFMAWNDPKTVYVGGIPSLIEGKEVFLPIDKFISSLYGCSYELELRAIPITVKNIHYLLNQLEDLKDKLSLLNQMHFTMGSGKGAQGSLNVKLEREPGKFLAELITKDLERCRLGLLQGFWCVEIKLTTPSNAINKACSIVTSTFGGKDSFPMHVRFGEKKFYTFLTSAEIATYICVPTRDIPGLTIKPLYNFGFNDRVDKTQQLLKLGEKLYDMRSSQESFSFDVNELTRHVLISGVTGSGKTQTIKKILRELSKQGIPFLVIEPAKSEYSSFPGVSYIEAGNPDKALRLNLFEPVAYNGRKTPMLTHIDYLRSVFQASYALFPPLPFLLEAVIHKGYWDNGWSLRDDGEEHPLPTLPQLLDSIDGVINQAGYTDKVASDLKAALKLRLSNLLLGYKDDVFDNIETSPSIHQIMTRPTVICLKRIVDDEQKALLMAFLLAAIYEYRELVGQQLTLQHVTVIEEAHRILSRTAGFSGDPELVNPKAKAVEFFGNLLAEIRAYGEGLIIAEQIPTKLIPEVIKNTGLKITHKLVSQDDKEIIASAMNFEEGHERFLAILEPGQAVVFSEKTVSPVVVDFWHGHTK